MARTKSEFLSSFGTAFELLKTLVNAVLDAGGNDDDLRRVLKDKTLARKFAEIVMQGRGIAVPDGCETLNVNYAQELVEAIKDCTFDWKNDNIVEKNFPNHPHETGEVTLTVKLFHFGRDMSSDDVVKEMDKEGFRPATLRELLAYAAKNPDEQRKYPIVALGLFWRHLFGREVPYLGIRVNGRKLFLGWWGEGWNGRYFFLAVRKS